MLKKKQHAQNKTKKFDTAKMIEQSAKSPDDFETVATHPQDTGNKKS